MGATDAAAVKARVSAVDVARAHGLRLRREGNRHVARCVFGHEDATPSLAIWPNRFHAFCCGAHGTAIDLEMALSGSTFADAVKRLADAPPSKSPIVAEPPRSYPPRDEVEELWHRCVPVDADADVSRWLGDVRGLDVARTVERDAARALPRSGPLPRWARRRREDWRGGGFHVVLPMFNAAGELASLHARSIVVGTDAKATSPMHHTTKGLVMADAAGREMLAGGAGGAVDRGANGLDIVVVEGAPAFIAWAVEDADHKPCSVLGVIAGSWTPAVAARVPQFSNILLDLDTDEAGSRYAAAIAETLDGRGNNLFRIERDS